MKTMRSHKGCQRGTQLVEMAIALPILLIISVIIYEGGRMILLHEVLNNAAREGARLSILEQNKYPVDCSAGCACPPECVEQQLKNAVMAYAARNGISDLTSAQITVRQDCQVPLTAPTTYLGCSTTCSTGGCMTASQISIQYQYTYKYLPSLHAGVPATVAIGTQAEFRNMY
ncbi:MAG TPA: TadE/TadG family type IV pilus assembly protein [Clostridia bacterium]|nr:TadE/TadG family type IV pilus assembly protein [Clostridia bacterium]